MKKTFHPFHIGEWWYCFAVIEGKLACFRSKKLTLAEGDSASGEGGEMKEAVSELFSLIAQLFVEKGLNVGDMPKLGIGVYSIQVNRTDHEINSVPGYHAYQHPPIMVGPLPFYRPTMVFAVMERLQMNMP